MIFPVHKFFLFIAIISAIFGPVSLFFSEQNHFFAIGFGLALSFAIAWKITKPEAHSVER